MKNIYISSKYTLPRLYHVNEIDMVQLVYIKKLLLNESISSFTIEIIDDEEQDRTNDLMLRSFVSYDDIQAVSILIKTGNSEFDEDREFVINISVSTSLGRVIKNVINFKTL